MGKALKWLGIIVGALLGVVLLALLVLGVAAGRRLRHVHAVEVEEIVIPDDPASLARGEYLATTICAECHGDGLVGELLFSETGIATVYAPNLTPSEAGVGHFDDVDYIRAMRHGVDPDGHAYMIMPAEVIINWSAEDLGSTIAYLKTLPPSDNHTPEREFTLLGRAMLGAGVFGQVFPAEYIDHDRPLADMPPIGVNAEYGEYVASAFACTMCHGADMEGGPAPANIPEIGEVPSLMAAAHWSGVDFARAVTEGIRPSGDELDSERMPWELYARADLADIDAIHLWLRGLAEQE